MCCIFVTYLRSILLSIILVFGNSTVLQMGLCLPVNVLCLMYFIKARPYSFKFRKRRLRNYIAIFHEAALLIFELLMLILGVYDKNMLSAFEK